MRKRECDGEVLFKELRVWQDEVPRSGPENMALDEALIAEAQNGPILRLYQWEDQWASLGYFQKFGEVRASLDQEVKFVRRWTAGGLVDHREDSTYTLIIPPQEKAARLRAGEGYREIHGAVVEALRKAGVACELTKECAEKESIACFEKPVRWDVVGAQGKLAGAGQRRGKWGVLHQGSVRGDLQFLADSLTIHWDEFSWNSEGHHSLIEKYASRDWLEKR